MNKGSLQQKHGTWYVVISYKDEFGKPRTKWISTKLRVGNNKTKAKEEMKTILKNLDLDKEIKQDIDNSQDVYFVDFLKSYLEIKKQQVEPITYSQYVKETERISSYFKDMRIKLKDLKPYHIEGFYKSLYEKGLSGNTVLHFHILIRECLQYAFKNDFVNVNVADKVDRPKTDGYKASFYPLRHIPQRQRSRGHRISHSPCRMKPCTGPRHQRGAPLKGLYVFRAAVQEGILPHPHSLQRRCRISCTAGP